MKHETIVDSIMTEIEQHSTINKEYREEIRNNLLHYRSRSGKQSLLKLLHCLKGGGLDFDYDKPEHLIRALAEISMFVTNANIDIAAKIVMVSPAANQRWKNHPSELKIHIKMVWNSDIGGNTAAEYFDIEPDHLSIPNQIQVTT